MSILNNSSLSILWDIPLEGIIFATAIILALYPILYLKGIRIFSDIDNWLRTKRVTAQIIIVIISFLFITITFGVTSNRLSDKWMDIPGIFHGGLKYLWLNPLTEAEVFEADWWLSDTDNNIKIHEFKEILQDSLVVQNLLNRCLTESCQRDVEKCKRDVKLNFYYSIKHKLLEISIWNQYLTGSQILINLSQVLSFSSWLILITSIGTRIYLGRENSYKKFSELIDKKVNANFRNYAGPIKSQYDFLKNYTKWMIIVSLICYLSSSYSWLQNEEEICAKTYGAFKASKHFKEYNKHLDVLYELKRK